MIGKFKIPEKYLRLITNLDEKQRYCVLGGVLLFVFLLDYFILMGPQLSALSKINPKIEILTKDIKETKDNLQKIEFYRGEVKRLKGKVKDTDLMVKPKHEVPLVLERISRIANQNGIKIDQIMPETQHQEILLEEKERTYYTLPIFIEARASYHDFGRFLNKIEKDEILLKVSSFTLKKGSRPRLHEVTVTLESIIHEEVDPTAGGAL